MLARRTLHAHTWTNLRPRWLMRKRGWLVALAVGELRLPVPTFRPVACSQVSQQREEGRRRVVQPERVELLRLLRTFAGNSSTWTCSWHMSLRSDTVLTSTKKLMFGSM